MTPTVELALIAHRALSLTCELPPDGELVYDVASGRISVPAVALIGSASEAMQAGKLVPASGPLNPEDLLAALDSRADVPRDGGAAMVTEPERPTTQTGDATLLGVEQAARAIAALGWEDRNFDLILIAVLMNELGELGQVETAVRAHALLFRSVQETLGDLGFCDEAGIQGLAALQEYLDVCGYTYDDGQWVTREAFYARPRPAGADASTRGAGRDAVQADALKAAVEIALAKGGRPASSA